MTKSTGTLYGIGVGPGDPQLLTLKALNRIQSVPVVAAPYADREKDSIALNTVQAFLSEDTEILKLHFKMVKDQAVRQQYRQKAAEKIAAYLETAQDVAFLSEGDVMLYSTFAYMLRLLAERYPIEVVPGISSILASAADTGVPLTINEQRLIVLPATHENMDSMTEIISTYDTVVMVKIHTVIEEISTILNQIGILHNSIVIEKASLQSGKIHREIDAIKNGQLPYMSQLIISPNTTEFLK